MYTNPEMYIVHQTCYDNTDYIILPYFLMIKVECKEFAALYVSCSSENRCYLDGPINR